MHIHAYSLRLDSEKSVVNSIWINGLDGPVRGRYNTDDVLNYVDNQPLEYYLIEHQLQGKRVGGGAEEELLADCYI
jgi:hypothetical protein